MIPGSQFLVALSIKKSLVVGGGRYTAQTGLRREFEGAFGPSKVGRWWTVFWPTPDRQVDVGFDNNC